MLCFTVLPLTQNMNNITEEDHKQKKMKETTQEIAVLDQCACVTDEMQITLYQLTPQLPRCC